MIRTLQVESWVRYLTHLLPLTGIHHALAMLTNDCTTCLLSHGDSVSLIHLCFLLLQLLLHLSFACVANLLCMTETALCLQDAAGKETGAVCLRQGTCPGAAATCVRRRASQQGRRATEDCHQEQCFDFWRKCEPESRAGVA